MFVATDTEWAPWYVARSENKKRVRLNVLSHTLERIPVGRIEKQGKIEFPERKVGRYTPKDLPLKFIPERF